MATVKVTVTLAEEQLRAIRELVADGAVANVSAFVQHAVALTLDDVAVWHGLLADALELTGGQLTAAERDWADEILAEPEADESAA